MTTLQPNKGLSHRRRRVRRRSESVKEEEAAAPAVEAVESGREHASVGDTVAVAVCSRTNAEDGCSSEQCRPGSAFFVATSFDVDEDDGSTTLPSPSVENVPSVHADNMVKQQQQQQQRSRRGGGGGVVVATERLDAKIASKIKRSEEQMTSSSVSTHSTEPVVSDRQSPRRAKSADSCRPGAFFVATSSSDDDSIPNDDPTTTLPSGDLSSVDANVLAKQKRSRGVVATEQLDDKIARKMTRSEDQMANASVSSRRSGSVSDRQSPRRVKSAKSLPGAYLASRIAGNGSTLSPSCCDLSSVESDVLDKQRSRVVVVVTERLDAKIANKMKIGDELLASSTMTNRASGPVHENVEDRVGKQAPRRVQSEESRRPGALCVASTSNDDGSTTLPSCDLKSVESDILAKQRSRVVAVTERLDAKIASKLAGEEPTISSMSNQRSGRGFDRQSPRRVKSEESCRPGAFFAAAISNDDGSTPQCCDLKSVESDILAKQRSRAVVVTERLDCKIASKMRGESPENSSMINSKSLPDSIEKKSPRQVKREQGRSGALFASTIPDGPTSTPSCDLSSVESDILAKQRSRVVVVTERLDAKIASKMRGEEPLASSSFSYRRSGIDSESQSEESRPGDFLAAAISGDGAQTLSCALSTAESDILAKRRSRVVVATEQLDAKIARKMRGEEPLCSTASNIPSKLAVDQATLRPGSVAENVNAMIAAKMRGDSQLAIQDELRDLEDGIQSKAQETRGESSLVDPENAVLQRLDERIAAKMVQSCAHPAVDRPEQGQEMENACPVPLADVCDNSQPRNPVDRVRSATNSSSSIVALAAESLDSRLDSNIATHPSLLRELSESKSMSISSFDSMASPRRVVAVSAAGHAGRILSPGQDKEETECEMSSGNINVKPFLPLEVEFGDSGGQGGEDGLAVAFAVEEDDGMSISSAVAYHPESKPPIYRHRRFQLYAFLSLVTVVNVAVGAVIGVLLSSGDPPPPALPDRSVVGIGEYAKQLVGVEALNDATHPYRKALEWIQFVDPKALTPDNSKFTQRFLLAYLYYSTSVDQSWTNGCEPSDVESVICTYMYRGRAKIDEKNKVDATRWLSSEDECTWGGVFCDRAGQVDKLNFSGSNMTAPSFPEGLARFPQLQHLTLNFGAIKGALPECVGEMKHLYVLEMAGNAFQGSIPQNWFDSRSIQTVNVGQNLLTGNISEAVRQWKDLKSLMVNNNMLTGRVPEELPTGIHWLLLDSNQLSGTVPSGLGKLSHMIQLFLFRNKLIGTLPPQLGSLGELSEIRLQGNELTGTFPNEWSKLGELWTLEISSNKLTGSILPKLVNLTKLEELRIDNNQFTGTFPKEFSALKQMVHMIASGNAFSGEVGPRICKMVKPDMQKGSSKNLEELTLDCAEQSNGVAEISCPCCTHCCDPDGTQCVATGVESPF